MTTRIMLTISPDGEWCGECVGTSHDGWQSCRLRVYEDADRGTPAMRGPSCLAAEREARELRLAVLREVRDTVVTLQRSNLPYNIVDILDRRIREEEGK